MTEAFITPQEKLVRACKLMVKHQKAMCLKEPMQRDCDGFAEGWLDMVQALKGMEEK